MAEPTDYELALAREIDDTYVRLSETSETLEDCERDCIALLAKRLAERREALASNPAFVLPAAEALLRQLGASHIVVHAGQACLVAGGGASLIEEFTRAAKQIATEQGG